MTKTPSATKNRQDEVPVEDLLKRLVLTGADIVRIGEDAELLVGGKNYNTALISRVEGVLHSSVPRHFVRGVPHRARRMQGVRGADPFHGRRSL